jgi:hypothetical protein
VRSELKIEAGRGWRETPGMEIIKQLSIFLENKPGTLAKVCEELEKAKINIHALTITDTVDHSIIRMVLSDPQRALNIFEERGVLAIENSVLMIENDNKPGSLGKFATRLAKAKINIEYAYLATCPKAKNGLLILRTGDTKRALKVLQKQ